MTMTFNALPVAIVAASENDFFTASLPSATAKVRPSSPLYSEAGG